MARWQWVIAVLALLALLLIALANHVGAQQPRTSGGLLYESIPFDATLLALDKRVLEEAYHQQLLKLFSVWLASGAPEDAHNFRNGLRIARRAYAQAMEQIAKREAQLNELDRKDQEKPQQ